mgnify:CR=1 FL=1
MAFVLRYSESDSSGSEEVPNDKKRESGDDAIAASPKRQARSVTLASLLNMDFASDSGLEQIYKIIDQTPGTIESDKDTREQLEKSEMLLNNPKFIVALLPKLSLRDQENIIKKLGDDIMSKCDFLKGLVHKYYERTPYLSALRTLFERENINKEFFTDPIAMSEAVKIDRLCYSFVADSVKTRGFMLSIIGTNGMNESSLFVLDLIRLFPDAVKNDYEIVGPGLREDPGFVIKVLSLSERKDIALNIAHNNTLKKIIFVAYEFNLLDSLDIELKDIVSKNNYVHMLKNIKDETLQNICLTMDSMNSNYDDFKYALKNTEDKKSIVAFRGHTEKWALRQTVIPDIGESLEDRLNSLFKEANVYPLPNVTIDFKIDTSGDDEICFNVYYNRKCMASCIYAERSFYLSSFFFRVDDNERLSFKEALKKKLSRSLVGYTMDLIVNACKMLNSFFDLKLFPLILRLRDEWSNKRDLTSKELMGNKVAREMYLQSRIGKAKPFKEGGDDTLRASERVRKGGYYGMWGFGLKPNGYDEHERVLQITDDTYYPLNASMSLMHI